MITDGEPQGESDNIVTQVAQRLRDDEANKRVVFFAVGVENANMGCLGEIVVRTPLKLMGLNFAEMFVWLSASMQKISQSKPDDMVALPLDTAQINVWCEVPEYVAAFSDGLQMSGLRCLFTLHRAFFVPLFDFVARMTDVAAAQEQLTVFLHSPRLRARVDDDVTLLIAARNPIASGRL